MMSELTGLLVGAILTIFILSYVVGDNALYRLALHLFIGALVGYSLGVVLRDVLMGMALPKLASNPPSMVAPFVLGILLLFKGFPKQAYVGNFSIAYLIGTGTAVAVGGALLGTLAPQVGATGRALTQSSLATFRLGLVDGVMIVVGTICTLLVFTFSRPARERDGFDWGKIMDGAAWIGRVFLVFAIAAAFAGAITASLSIFIARMQYLIDLGLRLVGP